MTVSKLISIGIGKKGSFKDGVLSSVENWKLFLCHPVLFLMRRGAKRYLFLEHITMLFLEDESCLQKQHRYMFKK